MYTPERQQKLQTVIIEQLMQKKTVFGIFTFRLLNLKRSECNFYACDVTGGKLELSGFKPDTI